MASQKIPLLIAHRGNTIQAPENTLAALQLAVEQGATALEVDLRICGSGEIVLFHDKTLARHFSRNKFIRNTSLSELKSLAFNKRSYEKPDKVATLAELFEEFKGKVPINLDAKTFGSNNRVFIEDMSREIDRQNMKDQVWVSAFNPLFLRLLKKLRPDIRRGFLFRNLAFIIRHLDVLHDAQAWHPHHSIINERFVKKARCKNKELYVWTVNKPEMRKSFQKYGIEGFITDKLYLCEDNNPLQH